MQHSREIRDQMHKLFEQMDANHDRTLSLEEASSVVGSSFAAHMISTMHADRSSAGGLSQDNWRDYFVKCSRAAQLTNSLGKNHSPSYDSSSISLTLPFNNSCESCKRLSNYDITKCSQQNTLSLKLLTSLPLVTLSTL